MELLGQETSGESNPTNTATSVPSNRRRAKQSGIGLAIFACSILSIQIASLVILVKNLSQTGSQIACPALSVAAAIVMIFNGVYISFKAPNYKKFGVNCIITIIAAIFICI